MIIFNYQIVSIYIYIKRESQKLIKMSWKVDLSTCPVLWQYQVVDGFLLQNPKGVMAVLDV